MDIIYVDNLYQLKTSNAYIMNSVLDMV